jgi:hypothetical protein
MYLAPLSFRWGRVLLSVGEVRVGESMPGGPRVWVTGSSLLWPLLILSNESERDWSADLGKSREGMSQNWLHS